MKRSIKMQDDKPYNEVYAHCKIERETYETVKEYARVKGMKIHTATTEVMNAGIKMKRIGAVEVIA